MALGWVRFLRELEFGNALLGVLGIGTELLRRYEMRGKNF